MQRQQLKIEQLNRGAGCNQRNTIINEGTNDRRAKHEICRASGCLVGRARAESVPERDAVITEFVKRHIAETDTAFLEA